MQPNQKQLVCNRVYDKFLTNNFMQPHVYKYILAVQHFMIERTNSKIPLYNVGLFIIAHASNCEGLDKPSSLFIKTCEEHFTCGALEG